MNSSTPDIEHRWARTSSVPVSSDSKSMEPAKRSLLRLTVAKMRHTIARTRTQNAKKTTIRWLSGELLMRGTRKPTVRLAKRDAVVR
jgi:hypothetical protein